MRLFPGEECLDAKHKLKLSMTKSNYRGSQERITGADKIQLNHRNI